MWVQWVCLSKVGGKSMWVDRHIHTTHSTLTHTLTQTLWRCHGDDTHNMYTHIIYLHTHSRTHTEKWGRWQGVGTLAGGRGRYHGDRTMWR